ncbi:Dual-specificity kinase, spindle pole body (SPB) duplication and spindle checkpoint function [Apophysomyces sp. BC1015]|nr:Dual-specificity kinase, spindle pole body (SPB) duplication and spindle checkpoint function [Apophysomyces sp. BC1015]
MLKILQRMPQKRALESADLVERDSKRRLLPRPTAKKVIVQSPESEARSGSHPEIVEQQNVEESAQNGNEENYESSTMLPERLFGSIPQEIYMDDCIYTVIKEIGSGGTSRVYEAHCYELKRSVALKVVDLRGVEERTVEQYRKEIEILTTLPCNEYIITLFKWEETMNAMYMVMELGQIDLASIIHEQKRKPLDMIFIMNYWKQMVNAVWYTHRAKIIHSDLKPSNFVLARGKLKLIDFGIANIIANDTTNIYREQQVGTVNYMSPESLLRTERGHKVGHLTFQFKVS